jgi:uncharacterized membrane-anchored protein
MIIYGTALLAVCHMLGIVCGDLLGRALGLKTNVGGVGIAMLFLIVMRLWLHKQGRLGATSESGVNYWGALYIPVVVAMAMLAATGSVVVCGCFISFINRAEKLPPAPPVEGHSTDAP